MTDKRNPTRMPTRMHEVLGVEPEERFMYSDYGDREFWLSESGLLYGAYDDGKVMSAATQGMLVLFINNPERITRRPRLTEEQVAQLKALVTLGFRWLIKNNDCSAFAYTYMPERMDERWNGLNAEVQLFLDMPTGVLYDLVSWSDPEPLDIVATLKAAGVEVE